MKAHYKYLLIFFNFHGILSLKIKNNNLTVSKFLVFLNFLLIPFISTILFLFYPVLFSDVFDLNITVILNISEFMSIALAALAVEYYLVIILVIYVQIWNRRKILIFIQTCLKVSKMLKLQPRSKVFKDFENACINKLVASLFIISVHKTLFFLLTTTRTVKSFFIFIILDWNEHIFLYFIFFCFIIISFFEVAVQSLNEEIENIDKLFRDKKNICDLILKNLEYLSKVTNNFNKIFGFLISFVTTYLVSVLTIRVRI